MLILRAPIVVAILLAIMSTIRRPRWGPILIGLTVVLGNDLLGERLQLPPRHDLALWLLAPAASSWCAWTVLARSRWWTTAISCAFAWALAATWILRAPLPRVWWPWATPTCLVCSIVAQAIAVSLWLEQGEIGSTAEAAAIGLFAGDLFELLGPAGLLGGPSWWAAAQASLVACLLVAYQIMAEIRSLRRG